MRPILLIASLFLLTLHAEVVEARYAISYGVLGRIGTTTLRLNVQHGRYRIDAEAGLEGIAALLARHHTERHTSRGLVNGSGRLVPDRYDTLRTMDNYRRTQRYLFDRGHRRILLRQQLDRNETRGRFLTETVPRHYRFARRLPYWALNDLLSLYFNARSALERMANGGKIHFDAVGSRDGVVRIEKEQRPSEFVIYVNQDIFRSREGKLHISVDREFFVKSAVLKDVFLFGDLKVEREWLKRSP